jgi:DNA-binding CsgD family transcriptional regulator
VSRIEKICATAADAVELRLAVVEELRHTVGFDAYAWLLTDPETSVGSAPLADVPAPLPADLPRLIRLKYLSTRNRWTALDSPAALAIQPDADGWCALLDEHGMTDVASSVYRDRYGCWGFLDLWRSGTPFSRADLDLLADLVPTMTEALRRCQANTFVARTDRDPRRFGPVVLLLSGELDVLGQTPETLKYLRLLVPPSEGRAPIPASAYNVAAQLLAVEAGVDHNRPVARVPLSGGRWMTLRAARIDDATIAVSIEETTVPERLAIFARAFALTDSETELLGELVTQTDTRELARRLFLSEHTVEDHLHSIFAKTGTQSSRTLLSRVLGT